MVCIHLMNLVTIFVSFQELSLIWFCVYFSNSTVCVFLSLKLPSPGWSVDRGRCSSVVDVAPWWAAKLLLNTSTSVNQPPPDTLTFLFPSILISLPLAFLPIFLSNQSSLSLAPRLWFPFSISLASASLSNPVCNNLFTSFYLLSIWSSFTIILLSSIDPFHTPYLPTHRKSFNAWTLSTFLIFITVQITSTTLDLSTLDHVRSGRWTCFGWIRSNPQRLHEPSTWSNWYNFRQSRAFHRALQAHCSLFWLSPSLKRVVSQKDSSRHMFCLHCGSKL